MRPKLAGLMEIHESIGIAFTFADVIHLDWLPAALWIGLLGTRVIRQLLANHRRRATRSTRSTRSEQSTDIPPDHHRNP